MLLQKLHATHATYSTRIVFQSGSVRGSSVHFANKLWTSTMGIKNLWPAWARRWDAASIEVRIDKGMLPNSKFNRLRYSGSRTSYKEWFKCEDKVFQMPELRVDPAHLFSVLLITEALIAYLVWMITIKITNLQSHKLIYKLIWPGKPLRVKTSCPTWLDLNQINS